MQLIITKEVAEEIAMQLVQPLRPHLIKVVTTEFQKDKFMNKKELAEDLNIGINTLNLMTQTKGFPKAIYSKYSRKAVDRWMEEVSK